MKKKLSVIVSCFNEEEAIPYFYKEFVKEVKKINDLDYELIFVDDGSRDKTVDIIKSLRKEDKKIRYISFSRNFGKEAAMMAGLEVSTGDFVTLMDADLQDPPALLSTMYDYIKNEGYDCVGTRRVTRKGEPIVRSFFARLFYKLINKMSKVEMVDGARDFRLMNRRMVDAIVSMKEYNRYSKGIFSFVGFKTKWLEYENIERVAGTTKWSFWKLFKYAIEGIVGFSTFPLILSSIIGILFCLVSFIMLIIMFIKSVFIHTAISSLFTLLTVLFGICGIQLFIMGIIGIYLSKIYLEAKNRPVYIVRETEADLDD